LLAYFNILPTPCILSIIYQNEQHQSAVF